METNGRAGGTVNNDIHFYRFLLWLNAKKSQQYDFYVIKVTRWLRTGQMVLITAQISGFICFTYEVVDQLNTTHHDWHHEKVHSGVISLKCNDSATVLYIGSNTDNFLNLSVVWV